MTESARQALSILRDGSQFQWYVIPIFVLVVYVYAVEIERRNWNLVFCGLALWGMDWFIFRNPFMLPAFVLLFIAILAETKRAPIDCGSCVTAP